MNNNQGYMKLVANPILYIRTNYIEMYFHFIEKIFNSKKLKFYIFT